MDKKTENKLRGIMYSGMGYTNEHGGWRKREIKVKKVKIPGQTMCSECKEHFDAEFLITRNNRKYCSECEKAILSNRHRELKAY